eukprot:14690455-Alexandrium_andersonii.AAC.1
MFDAIADAFQLTQQQFDALRSEMQTATVQAMSLLDMGISAGSSVHLVDLLADSVRNMRFTIDG